MKLVLSMSSKELQRILSKENVLKDYKGGILLSYMELRKNMDKVIHVIKRLKRENPGIFIMVDSGAHSFLYMYGKVMLKRKLEMGHGINQEVVDICKNVGIDNYVEEYAKFMYRYQKIFDCFVELDLQNLYGDVMINNWRELFYKACGQKLMIVWHGEEQHIIQSWADKYTFIGVGGTNPKGEKLNTPKTIKHIITKYPQNKFHLFALTGNELSLYSSLGLFSADSTSWNTGSRFGLFYYFENGKLRQKSKYLLRGRNKQNDEMNLLAWIQYGNYLNDIGKFKEE